MLGMIGINIETLSFWDESFEQLSQRLAEIKEVYSTIKKDRN
jgi:hypothetical protein